MKLLSYIDRRKTTIAILRDWNDQQWKVESGRDRVAAINDRMISISPRLGKEPVQGGGRKTEEMLCAAIDQKTIAEYGTAEAKKYFDEIAPCWERLTDDERFMLTARYVDNESERDGIAAIMDRYGIGKSKAFDLSSEALDRLAKLLFW